MSVFILWVWIGGACAIPVRKIGFFGRLFWPITLGEYLHEMSLPKEETK